MFRWMLLLSEIYYISTLENMHLDMSHLDFCFNLAIYLKYCGIAKLCSYFFSLLNEILSSSILESNWRLLSPRLKWPDANWCEFWTSSDTNWHVCIISCHLSALGLESIWRLADCNRQWPDANWCEFWTFSDTNWQDCMMYVSFRIICDFLLLG